MDAYLVSRGAWYGSQWAYRIGACWVIWCPRQFLDRASAAPQLQVGMVNQVIAVSKSGAGRERGGLCGSVAMVGRYEANLPFFFSLFARVNPTESGIMTKKPGE